MLTKTYDFTLDIKNKVNNDIQKIEVVQGDYKTNIFNITIAADFIPLDITGLTVNVAFKKADNTVVLDTSGSDTLTIPNATTGLIKCILRTQAIAYVGDVIATVSLVDSVTNEKLTSTEFKFKVRESIDNGSALLSTNDIPILTQLIGTTQSLVSSVGTLKDTVTINENTRNSFYNEFKVFETYSGTKPYKISNKVVYNGESYYCLQDCTGVLPSTVGYWLKFTSRGTDGQDGTRGIDGLPGINWINTPYSGLTTYNINDALYYDGASYRCIVQSLNHLPTNITYWTYISRPGLQGEQGLQGIQGIAGEKGETGSQGLQGETGLQGEQGLQGIQGIQGLKGETGSQGLRGEQGLQGLKGDKPAHQWVNTSLQVENPDGSWGTPVDLKGQDGAGTGDMLKSQFATNEKVSSGYVDKAILSDTATTANNVNGKTASSTLNTIEKIDLAIAINEVNSKSSTYTLPVATSSTLGGIKSGTDITVDGSGNVSVNDNSHNHTKANISDFPALPTSAEIRGDSTTAFRYEVLTTDPVFNASQVGRAWYRSDLDV